MAKKAKIEIDIPPYIEEAICERCGKENAADFQTEILCMYCVSKDVFESFNDVN